MCCLASADRIDLRTLDYLDLHVGHLTKSQNRIVSPAFASDALVVEADALLQNPTRRLNGAALDLVNHAVGIDGFADVDRKCHPLHLYVFRALDFRNSGAIGPCVLVARKTDAMADV